MSSASSPTTRPLLRLAGALLLEQNDEWLVGRRYLSAESLSAVLHSDTAAHSITEDKEAGQLHTA